MLNSDINKKQKYKNIIVIISLLVFLLIIGIVALCIGKYQISFKTCLDIVFRAITFQEQDQSLMDINVIFNLRLPRVLASILVGACLAVSGAVYQSLFNNPLVSPDFLGVSSGACVGASIGILIGLNSELISIFAFVLGILTVLLTALLPKAFKNRSNIMLVLSGIIIGSLMSSILGFIKFIADPEDQLASITYWMMGSFSNCTLKECLILAIIVIPSMIILLLMSFWLDVMSQGEKEARSLGANVKLFKTIFIIISTLLTAASVCISGAIGWVGLIIPHFSRLLVGSSNRRLIPVSILLGSIFMLLVDTFTRTIGPEEMPISIMTGILGVPFFIYLMYKRRNKLQ